MVGITRSEVLWSNKWSKQCKWCEQGDRNWQCSWRTQKVFGHWQISKACHWLDWHGWSNATFVCDLFVSVRPFPRTYTFECKCSCEVVLVPPVWGWSVCWFSSVWFLIPAPFLCLCFSCWELYRWPDSRLMAAHLDKSVTNFKNSYRHAKNVSGPKEWIIFVHWLCWVPTSKGLNSLAAATSKIGNSRKLCTVALN